MRYLIRFGWACSAMAVVAFCQAPEMPNPAAGAMKIGKWIRFVSDMDRSYAFYHEAFGFEGGGGQVRKLSPAPDSVVKLLNWPEGTQYRTLITRPRGIAWTLELVELSSPGHVVNPQPPDATLGFLRVRVRDIGSAVTAALKNGGSVMTDGRSSGVQKNRMVTLKDPDGFLIEMVQADSVPATIPADSPLVGGNFAVVVKDAEKTRKLYESLLDPATRIAAWKSTDPGMKAFGAPEAQMHRPPGIGGMDPEIEFIQFGETGSSAIVPGIGHPLALSLGLNVADVGAATGLFTSTGGKMASADGMVNPRSVFITDRNEFSLELNQAGGGRGGRAGAPAN